MKHFSNLGGTMVAGLIKKKDKVSKPVLSKDKPSKPQPGFNGNYKGYKPSAASVQAEEQFKAVLGPLAQPGFVSQPVEWLAKVASHMGNVKYMWDK